jgi:hypothetical protein
VGSSTRLGSKGKGILFKLLAFQRIAGAQNTVQLTFNPSSGLWHTSLAPELPLRCRFKRWLKKLILDSECRSSVSHLSGTYLRPRPAGRVGRRRDAAAVARVGLYPRTVMRSVSVLSCVFFVVSPDATLFCSLSVRPGSAAGESAWRLCCKKSARTCCTLTSALSSPSSRHSLVLFAPCQGTSRAFRARRGACSVRRCDSHSRESYARQRTRRPSGTLCVHLAFSYGYLEALARGGKPSGARPARRPSHASDPGRAGDTLHWHRIPSTILLPS